MSVSKCWNGRALLVCCSLLLLVGCRPNRLQTGYGESTGYSGRNSINGFAALRTLYEEAGWRNRSISKLNPRARRLQAIVWIPSTPTAIQLSATEWFEEWMQDGDKTLVYVTYDGLSDAAYWRQAARYAPPLQRLEYRRRLARAQLAEFQRALREAVPESNGWLKWEKLPQARSVDPESLRMKRTASASAESADSPSVDTASLEDSTSPDDFDLAAPLSIKVELAPATNVADEGEGTNGGGTKTAGGATAAPGPFLSPSLQVVDGTSSADVRFRPLVSLESGPPLLVEITSAAWGDSKVLVVAGGTLLDNFAFTTDSGRMLASQIVSRSGTPEQIGFLETGASTLFVDDGEGTNAARNGMELLVVWPLSLITVHGALLGMVIVLSLMPIFGRPRRLKQPSQTDFADHIDAVAKWMDRAPGEIYARQKISEYMRRVRGDTSGKWVLSEHRDDDGPARAGE